MYVLIMAEGGSPVEPLKESGWDRVKSLFSFRRGDNVHTEVKDLSLTVFVASIAGFLFGGMLGSRHAGDRFIALNHASKFTSTMQAQRELHAAALSGFIRKGSLWGWRVGLFAGVFSGSTLLLSLYRNKQDAANYIGAGAATGGLFRISRGFKPFIGGTLLGTLLSIPIGFSMHGLDLLLVSDGEREEIRNNKIKERQKQREQWETKLGATTQLIQVIENPEGNEGLKTYYKLSSSSSSDNPRTTTVNTSTNNSNELRSSDIDDSNKTDTSL